MTKREASAKSPLVGTCEWLSKHATYKTWLQQGGVLIVLGTLGSGKSTLTVHALERHRRGQDCTTNCVVVSYFFDAQGVVLQRSIKGLLMALIHGLLPFAKKSWQTVTRRFQNYENGRGPLDQNWTWDCKELKTIVQDVIREVLKDRPVRLFIDALNEASADAVQDAAHFLESLASTASHEGSSFSIFLTCRHWPEVDIKTQLKLVVEEWNHDDIAHYITHHLCRLMPPLSSYDMKELASAIEHKSVGFFPWTVLVVEKISNLTKRGYNRRACLQVLEDIPAGVAQLYEHTLRSMKEDQDEDERMQSLKLFQWLCFTARPLTQDELQIALAIDPSSSDITFEDIQNSSRWPEDMFRRVEFLSCGLAVTIVTETTRKVRLLHGSVEHYMLAHGFTLLRGFTERTPASANREIYRCILAYMRTLREDSGPSHLETALWDHACSLWPIYAKAAGVTSLDLREFKDTFTPWIIRRMQEYFQTRRLKGTPIGGICETIVPDSTTALHLAACVGIPQEPGDLKDIESHTRNLKRRTPLLLAAEHGHIHLVEQLVTHADLRITDAVGQTALDIAIAQEHWKIAEVLLCHGGHKDPRLCNKCVFPSQSSLQSAVRHNKYELLSQLVSGELHSCNLNGKTVRVSHHVNRTLVGTWVTSRVVKKLDLAALRILVEADCVRVTDDFYRIPGLPEGLGTILEACAFCGDQDMIRYLVEVHKAGNLARALQIAEKRQAFGIVYYLRSLPGINLPRCHKGSSAGELHLRRKPVRPTKRCTKKAFDERGRARLHPDTPLGS